MSVFNQEDYLKDSIDSILNQDFEDLKFVIVNDGSNDKSSSILESYSDKRIVVVNNEKNIGLISSLNKGLGFCLDSKYVARMDSDDIAFGNRLSTQMTILEENKSIGMIGTGVEFFGNGLKAYKKIPPKGHKDIVANMICQNPFYHPTIMFRSATLVEYNLRYSMDFPKYEDYALWATLANKCQLANLPEVLLKYRRHGTNEGAVYNKDPELDAKLFARTVTMLCQNLNLRIEEREIEVLSIISSSTRATLNPAISLDEILALSRIIKRASSKELNLDYLKFKLYERSLLYLLTTKRYSEIPRLTFLNNNFTVVPRLLAAQYTRQD